MISQSFAVGFIPFLTGIMFYLNYQIERWSIAYYIDTEFLGRFFLAGLYNTLFILVPNSMNTLFFPRTLNNYVAKEHKDLKTVLKRFALLVALYSIVTVIGTLLFIEPVTAFFFPKHLIGIQYVYIILPGLIALSFTLPIMLLLNASLMLKPILIGYSISISLTIVLIALSVSWGRFTLTTVAYIDSIASIALLLYSIAAYFRYRTRIWNLT